jgi:enoyl-CoA hydratase/carnithine racemase
MYQTLLYQKEGPISVVQLNRPQKKNAFNAGGQHRSALRALIYTALEKSKKTD